MERVKYTVYGSWVYRCEGRKVYRMNRDGSIGGQLLVVEDGELTGHTPRVRHHGSFCRHADMVLELAQHLAKVGDVVLVDANQQGRPHECFRTIPTVIAEVAGRVVYVHDIDVEADCYPECCAPGGALDPERVLAEHAKMIEAEDAERQRLEAERAAEADLLQRLATADEPTLDKGDLRTIAGMLSRIRR